MSYITVPGVIFRNNCLPRDVLDDLRGRLLCHCHIEVNTLRDKGGSFTAIIFAVNTAGAAWLFHVDCANLLVAVELRQALQMRVRQGDIMSIHSGEPNILKMLRQFAGEPAGPRKRELAQAEPVRAIEL